MTSSIVFSRPQENSHLEREKTVLSSYASENSFPTDTVVTFIPRENSSMKISFAPGTQFTDRNRSKVAEKVRKTKYTIKPVSQKAHAPMLYRAPASTMPSTPMLSTTKRDFQAPEQNFRRTVNPPPKWFYRTSTDLLVSQSGLDVGKVSQSDSGQDLSESDTQKEKDAMSRTAFRTTKSLYLPSQPRRRDRNDTLLSWYAKEGPSMANNIPQFKPLIGNIDGRVIEKARLRREVKLPENLQNTHDQQPPPTEVQKPERKIRRNISFSESLRPFQIGNQPSTEIHTTSTVKNSGTNLNKQKSRSYTNIASADVTTTGAVPLRKEKTTFELSDSMQRTYQKQAMLKEMLKK